MGGPKMDNFRHQNWTKEHHTRHDKTLPLLYTNEGFDKRNQSADHY
jgi:hypothetical protein